MHLRSTSLRLFNLIQGSNSGDQDVPVTKTVANLGMAHWERGPSVQQVNESASASDVFPGLLKVGQHEKCVESRTESWFSWIALISLFIVVSSQAFSNQRIVNSVPAGSGRVAVEMEFVCPIIHSFRPFLDGLACCSAFVIGVLFHICAIDLCCSLRSQPVWLPEVDFQGVLWRNGNKQPD